MVDKLCVFAFSYSPNRKAMLDYFEKIFPKETEIFFFTTKQHKNNYNLKRIKVVDTNCSRFGAFFELRKFCKKNKIQRIINLGLLPYEGFVMAYSTLFTKTDFVCFHLGYPLGAIKEGSLKNRIIGLFEALLSYLFAIFPKKIIFCSEDLYDFCKKNLPFIRKKIFFLSPTIPTDFFIPENKEKARKKLNLNQKDKIIIYVGRIGYFKGSDILVKLAEKNPDKKFILVGGLIDKKFKNYKLPNLILLPQKKPQELKDYYNAADVCLFPSRIESFGLVPREAMSCGIPAIVSDIPAFKNLEFAIRVPLDVKKMNSALNDFFNLSKKEKKKLSVNSRKFILKSYNEKYWKDKYINKIIN